MQIRWLGWAGVEIAAQGERVVIDPLADPLAVFACSASARMPSRSRRSSRRSRAR
jgi:hypothetical protein